MSEKKIIARNLTVSPAAGVLVKCGGFSTQLAKRVDEKVDGDPLWGSRFDAKDPDAVVQTHLDFLRNGAQIILSNTYQSSVEGFMLHMSLTHEQSVQLIRKSVKLAKEAKRLYLQMVAAAKGIMEPNLPLVLASIGPYGAHLHDGSEYTGHYASNVDLLELQRWHRTRIVACLAEGVDGLAVETIPCLMEAEAVAAMIIKDYRGVRFWVSFQCKDEANLANGESFADAVVFIWRMVQAKNVVDRLLAIGVNCVNPKFVTPLLKSVHAALGDGPKPPLSVYSNRGEIYDAALGEWTEGQNCVPIESYVPEWLQLGVKIVGGCCRVYPDDILRIRKCIDNIGNNN